MASKLATVLLLVLSLCAACAPVAPFVWIDSWADPASPKGPGGSVIAIGDTVSIKVWNQDGMSMRARVRNDGKISVPLLGDVEASGKRPFDLGKQLEEKLTKFMLNPSVMVNVDEVHTMTVSVLGEVSRPGVFNLRQRAGILEALANAGGFTEFAGSDGIYVLRGGDRPVRLRVAYPKLTAGTGRSAAFALRDGDVIVVE